MNKIYKASFVFISVIFCTLSLHGQIKLSSNNDTIGAYEVFELDIEHPQSYPNNWENVTLTATFAGGRTINIRGFYFDTHLWKVRFAPPSVGTWNYSITFTTPTNSYSATGSFVCKSSATKGFLRRHPNNPFRLIYADGTLFNGIGIGDCILDNNRNGTPHDDWGFDGDLRPPGEVRPYPVYSGSSTTLENYMRSYGENGGKFNLFRWSTDNCAFRLYNSIGPAGNSYFVNEGKWGDSLVTSVRKNNIRLWMVLFGYPLFKDIDGSTPQEEAVIKRYIDYVVARYGAYVDIWELFNEAFASDYYIRTITQYIRSIDPYHRLISISEAQPADPNIDINSPHWYEKESEFESDVRAWDMIVGRKRFNKPIMFGEQGNSVQNWDPQSALRMRIRSWTAFFAEGIFIFWNASWTKEYVHNSANIYLGPLERSYINAMQRFTAVADSAVTPFSYAISNNEEVRGYGLRSPRMLLGYFHHYNSHSEETNVRFTYRFRYPGKLYWVNPSTNHIMDSLNVKQGVQTLVSPAFNIDMALRVVLDSVRGPVDVHTPLELLVYPNPAQNDFFLEGNFAGEVTVELFDLTGRRWKVLRKITNNQKINVSDLPPGIYFYKVTATDQRQTTGKIAIVK